MTDFLPIVDSTLEKEVARLTARTWEIYEQAPLSKRILIGISGIPGSGKSTLAGRVAQSLNALYQSKNPVQDGGLPNLAVDVSMDGFHYSRADLAAMPDPETAIHRRGAAFTYDGDGFCQLVRQLRDPLTSTTNTVYAPSFDHALKDPVADSVAIYPSHRIVILEGNYLSLDREPWKSAALLMDQLWFVAVTREVAKERLAKRHVASGITDSLESAYDRIMSTDFLNADDIEENGLEVHEVVKMGQ